MIWRAYLRAAEATVLLVDNQDQDFRVRCVVSNTQYVRARTQLQVNKNTLSSDKTSTAGAHTTFTPGFFFVNFFETYQHKK